MSLIPNNVFYQHLTQIKQNGFHIENGSFPFYPHSPWCVCVGADFVIVYAALPSTCLACFIPCVLNPPELTCFSRL